MNKEIPSRSQSQIKTHAQKFFLKVSRILPKNENIIEFIRSKPPEFFMNLKIHLNSESKRRIRSDSNQDQSDPKSNELGLEQE